MEMLYHFVAMFTYFIDFVLHLDVHLLQLMNDFGPWLYAIIFLIVFCETGLVVTPFLPGDSLLFALGALCAMEGSSLSLIPMMVLLIVAGVLGDATNYAIGNYLGPKVFTKENSFLLNKKHLEKTQKFYEKHGPFTIIIARFVPIVRTFAPFVAGIGKMSYSKFASYNVIGAIAWVVSFSILGYFFGNLPIVKKNFSILIFGIIFVSTIPIFVGLFKDWQEKRRATQLGQ